jgi:hypothetical protein
MKLQHAVQENQTPTTEIQSSPWSRWKAPWLVLAVACLALGLVGCVDFTGGRRGNPNITPPDASRSPNMDFTKIASVGIFPLFPSGQSVENEQFAESLISTLTGEIQQRQSQWKILSYKDILTAINTGNLGTGYKNLQADYNTFGGPGGQLILSPATREFLKDLRTKSGADAFLIGSYTLGAHQEVQQNIVFGPVLVKSDMCTVRVSLFYAKDEQNWWMASINRYGKADAIVNEIAQSLASYMGKGTLRQL